MEVEHQKTLFQFEELQKQVEKVTANRPDLTKKTGRKTKKYHIRPCQWCGKPILNGKRIDHWEEFHLPELKKRSVNGYRVPGRKN